MADKFPQSDLPRSVSGGSDVWDVAQASVILGGEFFAAPSDEFAGSAACVVAASAGLTVTAAGGGGNCGAPNVVGRTWAESATCAKPAGTTNGDYLVATCNIPWSSATSSAPTGWSEIGVSKTTDTSNHEVRMFARWVGSSPGSDGSDYTFPNSAYTVITNYRGVHTTDPIAAVVPYKFDNWSSTETFEHPGITVDAACAIIFGINGSRSSSFQPPRFGRSLVYGDYGEQAGLHCSVIEAAGSTDAISLYQEGNSGIYASLMVALRGAPGTITAPYPLNVYSVEGGVSPTTLTRPAWLKENDVIVFFDTKSNTNLGSFSPSDFTQIGANGEPTVYYRKVGPIGSEPSSYVATASGANNFSGAWVVVGGVDPTSPLSATLVRNDGYGVTTRSHPGVSVTVDNSTVLAFFEGNGGWPKTADEAGRYIYRSGPLYAFTRNTGATGTLISQTFDGPNFKALAFAFAPIPAGSGGVAQELTGSLAVASTTLANLFKTSTQSASASGVVSTTAGLSKTAVLAGAASGVATVAADLAVSKPLAASVQSVASASAITPPIGKPLTAAVAAISTTSADLTTGALQSLAGAISATSAASAALTKTAALAAGVAAVANIGGAELTLGKPLAGSGAVVAASTGLLNSVHALAGDAQAVGAASATLTKQSAQAGSAGAVASASADLSRTATLAAAVSAQASAALDLTKVAALASNAQAVSVTTANLSLNRNLQASVAAVVVTSADLLVLGDFGGNANASATASAALSLGKPIAGDAQSASNAFASLQVVIPLSGALSVVSIASADPRVAWALSSNVVVQTVTTADVSLTKPIAASVASVAAGAAGAQVLKRMDASAACVSSASAGLSLTKPIAGAAQSITSVEADLSNDLGGGDAKSVCVAIGGLSIEKPLEGAAVGGAPDIVAALSLTATLAADLITQAAANANVALAKPLAGAALSVVSASSPLDHTLTLASNVGAQSNSLGALVVRKEMAATLQVQSAANVTPIYLLSLASGITVRSTATLFVPDINFADGVDAVIEMFAIHAAIVSDDKSASIIVDAITVEVDG